MKYLKLQHTSLNTYLMIGAWIALLVIGMSSTCVIAAEAIAGDARQANAPRRPGAFNQQRFVQDFLDKKAKIEGLIQKQKMYESLLADMAVYNNEIDRMVQKEKTKLVLKKLDEVNEQMRLINEASQAG